MPDLLHSWLSYGNVTVPSAPLISESSDTCPAEYVGASRSRAKLARELGALPASAYFDITTRLAHQYVDLDDSSWCSLHWLLLRWHQLFACSNRRMVKYAQSSSTHNTHCQRPKGREEDWGWKVSWQTSHNRSCSDVISFTFFLNRYRWWCHIWVFTKVRKFTLGSRHASKFVVSRYWRKLKICHSPTAGIVR